MANAYTASTTAGAVSGGHLSPPFYADFLRQNLYGSLFWRQLGTNLTIPRGRGTKAKISRMQTPLKIVNGAMVLSGAITAIVNPTEGTPIDLFKLCASDITGHVCAWAGGRGYTDKLVIVSMADMTEGFLESLSKELAFRLDRYARTTTSANAFTQYAITPAGAASTVNKVATTTVLNGKNLARIRALMAANGCPRWDDGTYVGMTHDLALSDIFSDISASGYVSINRYSPQRLAGIFKGEIGELYGVRWLLTNGSVQRIYGATTTTATFGISASASGTNAFIFSPDSFFNLELESGGVEVIHQPLGSGGATGDPAAQVGGISVKVWYGALPQPSGDKRMMRLVHGLSLHY